jgi:hypothetical protein
MFAALILTVGPSSGQVPDCSSGRCVLPRLAPAPVSYTAPVAPVQTPSVGYAPVGYTAPVAPRQPVRNLFRRLLRR